MKGYDTELVGVPGSDSSWQRISVAILSVIVLMFLVITIVSLNLVDRVIERDITRMGEFHSVMAQISVED